MKIRYRCDFLLSPKQPTEIRDAIVSVRFQNPCRSQSRQMTVAAKASFVLLLAAILASAHGFPYVYCLKGQYSPEYSACPPRPGGASGSGVLSWELTTTSSRATVYCLEGQTAPLYPLCPPGPVNSKTHDQSSPDAKLEVTTKIGRLDETSSSTSSSSGKVLGSSAEKSGVVTSTVRMVRKTKTSTVITSTSTPVTTNDRTLSNPYYDGIIFTPAHKSGK